nr:peroxidase-like protein 5 [Halisarca dujardinii]
MHRCRSVFLAVLASLFVAVLSQDFGSFFDNPSNVQNVIQEVRATMDKAKEMRRAMDAEPMDYKDMSAGKFFRIFFKRDLPGVRDVADSRKSLEMMVEEIDRRRDWFGRPGEGIPARVMDELMEASLCNVAKPVCNDGDRRFRRINGTCNDLRNTLEGGAFSNFRRIVPAAYEDGVQQPVGFLQAYSLRQPTTSDQTPPAFRTPSEAPSARLISQRFIQDLAAPATDSTLMLMQWGQFCDHDFAYLIEASVLEPEEEECEGCRPIGECLPIRVPTDDPDFGASTPNGANCLRFERAAAVCRPKVPGIFNPREQLNQITSWLDASMVYGSLDEEQPQLRRFVDGELLERSISVRGVDQRFMPLDPAPRMPCLPPRPCFRGGDLRANEQMALTAMHTTWVRYHNNLVRQLKKLNPTWDDERLFQETRKIVYATVEAITFNAYLPRMMGQQTFDQFIGRYTGYSQPQDGDLVNSFGAAAYRIGHSQVQPTLLRLNADGTSIPEGPLSLELAFFNPDELVRGGGIEPLMRGLMSAQSRKVDQLVTRVLTTRLFAQSNELRIGMDLASLNIKRGRDHGIPKYGVFRNFCTNNVGLTGTLPAAARRQLEELYGSVEEAELWPAGMAEEPLPGSQLGGTFACIWAITFRSMRDADRFWYENPGVFTPAQLDELRKKATLSSVICNASPNIGRLPRDAFSATDSRVDCSLIPQLDLSLWSESSSGGGGGGGDSEPCWVKVQTLGAASRQSFARTVFRLTSDPYSWTKGEQEVTEPQGAVTQAACVQFRCPTEEVPITLAVQAKADLLMYTSSTPSSALPVDRAAQGNIYKANLVPAFGPQFGIYKSEEICRRGGIHTESNRMNPFSGVAVTFRG